MKKIAVLAALAVSILSTAVLASAQQAPSAAPAAAPVAAAPAAPAAPRPPSQPIPGWWAIEISGVDVPLERADALINQTCKPSGLDGIQLLALQKGHNEMMNLHVYCREDKAANVHYKVYWSDIKDKKLGASINPALANPNLRIGPFFFGKEGQADSFLAVEKVAK